VRLANLRGKAGITGTVYARSTKTHALALSLSIEPLVLSSASLVVKLVLILLPFVEQAK